MVPENQPQAAEETKDNVKDSDVWGRGWWKSNGQDDRRSPSL